MAPRQVSVCQVIEATAGGTRKHLRLLLEGLSRERFRLAAVVSCRRKEEGFLGDLERFRSLGVNVVDVPMAREICPLEDLRSYRALKAALADIRPDVVHTHGSKGGFLGRLAARAVGVRAVVHTPHIFAFQWNRGWRRSLFLALERFAARRCDRIVCLSEAQRRITAEAGVLPSERLTVIPNGIDANEYPGLRARGEIRSEFGLPPDAPVVGMVGRLMPQKGCGNFIRAAALVARELPAARFVLVGGGPLEGELRREADALGLSGRLVFAGHREDAAGLYPAFDLFVLSSLWEGMPYVVLEAMASRLAVVATRIPGMEDVVVEGETGSLVPLDSTGEIARAISSLLADREKRSRMGEAGRARVEREFTLPRFIAEHERLYEELVKD
jgi:glycosyltransferase involved in cell wall biosynthesis